MSWTLHGWWLLAALWAAFNAGALFGAWLLRELRLARQATTLPTPVADTSSTTGMSWAWPE